MVPPVCVVLWVQAAWLSGTDLPKIAAIGYDSRHNSELFAQVCAVAFAEAGIHTWLYDRLAPTPMLSYAVRELGCGCGIVISASHNAGAYNGVKCYGPDGCQMTDEPAAIVTAKISEIPYFIPETKSFEEFMKEEGMTGNFPLLVKIIDAADKLSVQVHPDDKYAHSHGIDQGKTEMWYILDAV